MGREEQLLAIKIASTLEKAKAAEEAYVRIIETSNAHALNDPENDELHDQEEILEHYIKEAFRECRCWRNGCICQVRHPIFETF
jgi:hypothetical protein